MICGHCANGSCGACAELNFDAAKLADGLPDYATAHFCCCQHQRYLAGRQAATQTAQE